MQPRRLTPKRIRHAVSQFANRGCAVSCVPEADSTFIAGCKRAEEVLEKSEEQYQLLFEHNPIPMWVFDRNTLRFLAVNHAAIRQYGYTEQEFLVATIADIRPKEEIAALLADVEKRNFGLQQPGIWRHRRKNGSLFDVEIVGHSIEYRGVEAMLIAGNDVTERKQAEAAALQAERKYRTLFENAVVGIFRATVDGRPLSINRAMARMHGYDSPEELMESISGAAQLFVDPGRMAELHSAVVNGEAVRNAEVEIYCKDHSTRWILVNLQGERDGAGNVLFVDGTTEDITARKLAEERIQFLAYFDALTELPNRSLMYDRLAQALATARRRNEKVAVIFLDLDRFKQINDSLGHTVGDLLLQEVGKRIKGCTRQEDTVSRIGGDEFIILLTNGDEASVIASRVARALTATFEVKGHSLNTSCSIGISMFPDHGDNGEALIKYADQAMYCAKESGRNACRFFNSEMNRQITARATLENDLRGALEREEFFLVYQPQVAIESGELAGFEALIRWRHPQLGLVTPDKFIGLAENTGLILPIGEWVLNAACSQARRWVEEGLLKVPVAVNVSAVQFRQAEFCELIKRVLGKCGLPPQYLELELTESLLLTNQDVMLSVLQQLKEMGLNLAIDDFGTGYSSLSYLKQFNVNKLKIDRSFIREITTSSDDAAITIAIINMAKSLHLTVIAEGVEDKSQFEFLRAHKCDEVQGYYISKPGTATEVAGMFLSRSGAGY
jgi:diguanylate cyclase (GGDEF)-like protein/PAS domain S-box-containing protein